MKKTISLLAVLLFCGCSAVPETNSEIVYAAAEYCMNDECSEKVRVKYDDAEIAQIESYLKDCSFTPSTTRLGREMVELILIDEKGLQYKYTEESITDPNATIYYLNDYMYNCSIEVEEDERLIHFVKGLKGEPLAEGETLGYEVGDNFFVVSMSGEYIKTIPGPGGDPYFEGNQFIGKPALSLLFYINESFTDASQIKDQKRLLTGIISQLEFPLNYEPHVAVYDDTLLYSATGTDSLSVLLKGSELFEKYQLPKLSTSMLGSAGYDKYYYDEKSDQFIKQTERSVPTEQSFDMILMPIQINDQRMRLVKVKVRNFKFKDHDYIQMVQPIAEGVDANNVMSYRNLFDHIVNHLDKFELLDVVLDEHDRIQSVELIQQIDQREGEPVQCSDFILNANEFNSIYTHCSISEQAMLYNDFLRSMNSNYSYQKLESELKENEDFISITIKTASTSNVITKHILIDKKDGVILADGMLNERYFDNQLEAEILKQLADQKLEVCALAYEDNTATPRCYVKPVIADVYDPNPTALSFSSFIINDEGELVLPVLIREYGGYTGMLEINPQR